MSTTDNRDDKKIETSKDECAEFELDGKKFLIENVASQILPKGNKILVKKLKSVYQEYTRKNVIIVASSSESTESKFTLGFVVSVGEKVTNFKAGEFVIYGKWSGIELQINDGKYSLIKDEDISSTVIFNK